MDETAALIAINNLRSQPAYLQAELLRLRTTGGAVALAEASQYSDEYAAIHLLVNTWETIAAIVEGVVDGKDRIFSTQPICYMHRSLKDAIVILSRKHAGLAEGVEFDIPNNGLGAKFTKLANDFDSWCLATHKPTQYITGACSGMQAYFG